MESEPKTLIKVAIRRRHHAGNENIFCTLLKTNDPDTPLLEQTDSSILSVDCPYHERYWRVWRIFIPMVVVLTNIITFGFGALFVIYVTVNEFVVIPLCILVACLCVHIGHQGFKKYLSAIPPTDEDYEKEVAAR